MSRRSIKWQFRSLPASLYNTDITSTTTIASMCNIIGNCCVSCRRLVGIKIRTCSTAPPGCMCLSDDGVRQLPTIMSNIIITTTDGVIVADLTKMFSMLKVFNKHPDYAHSCRPSDLLGNADGRHDDVEHQH